MTGLILAAGNGTRLSRDDAHPVCKALAQVDERPLITFALDMLVPLGVERAVIVVGRYGREISESLGDTYRGMTLQYAAQSAPIGLVNAMLCAKSLCKDDVALLLGDEIFLQPQPAATLLNAFANADFLVGYTADSAEKIRQNYSLVTNENGELLDCTEKPTQVVNDKKGTGFCLFSADCFALLENAYDAERNAPCELCDFLKLLLRSGKTGVAVPVAEREININTPTDLQEAIRCVQRLK